ncbi:MAG: GNAT family N-acetyltransferase [Acidobacteriota bacterium]
MNIVTADPSDVEHIFQLYDKAIEFQKQVFDKHWLGFEVKLVDREIAEGRLWKILEDGLIACIFSIAYEDPFIWGEDSSESAMYIHRIVTDPKFRGRGYVKTITEWAKDHARGKGFRFIRMDTWGDNLKLLEYYKSYGFQYLGNVSPQDSDTMPEHYRGITLSLFEIDLRS